MAGKNTIPLYDELVKSPEFSDLDYEEEKDFRLGRKDRLGAEDFEMQEHISFQNILAENYNRDYKMRSYFNDGTPLYDEVVKSPEFSELENDEEAKIITETVKRNDSDGEPYETQEKITVIEEEINTKQTNNNTDYENMKVTDLRGIVKELNSHLTWNQVKAMNKKKLVETLKKNKREK